jgi:hypothetical protein
LNECSSLLARLSFNRPPNTKIFFCGATNTHALSVTGAQLLPVTFFVSKLITCRQNREIGRERARARANIPMTESAKKKAKIGADDVHEVDLEKCMHLAQKLARECGQLVGDAFVSHVRSVEYKGTIDLVTETDKEVEKRIFDGIRQMFPSHKLIGEETVSAGGTETLTDAPTWIVDPIDGTTNFVHGVPWCAISIGFSVRKLLVLGVVYNPALDELFSASIGLGAQLNGKRISVSKTAKLQVRASIAA